MITRSIDNYEQHKEDIRKILTYNYGPKKANKFIDFYSSRYNKFDRSFINYRLAWSLFDDYRLVAKSGVRWYACVGEGGTGKTTLGMNISYFLDPTFDRKRIHTTADDTIKQLAEFPKVNTMKSVILDEPDDSIHPNSKKGRLFRSILGKARQQKLFMFYCATTMTDIPPYIYKKISGIFFTPSLGKGMFFKNRPAKKDYVVAQIKEGYKKYLYGIFYKMQKSKGCLNFSTSGATPLNPDEDKQYLDAKAQDYDRTIKEYLNLDSRAVKKPQTNKDFKIIMNMREEGYSQTMIAKILGVSQPRISTIIKENA